MRSERQFRGYDPDQLLLLPPDMRAWLPEGHLVHFISEVVDGLDLGAIERVYEHGLGGQPAYHPRMMVKLLLYAYCVGTPSSRKMERLTYESVPFRVLTADQQPDHSTIAEFRKRHLKALSKLFVQVLRLCQGAGLVKLGHVALDGTKVRANASKHKAMSYGRMEKEVAELEAEVTRLLAEAERVDGEEDELYGKDKRGDELPEELRTRQGRLKKIQEAKRALEQEAKARAEEERREYEAKKQAWVYPEPAEWENRTECRGGRPPKKPSGRPDPKAQRNFTDPDSRIMKDGATNSFEQCYNCQAAVDKGKQIIVATKVTQDPNDKGQVKPVLEQLKKNTGGKMPKVASMDAGYYSKSNVDHLEKEGIDAYVATGKEKHSHLAPPARRGRIPKNATVKERMQRKLRTIKGRCTYAKRKWIAESVFGQIKEVRGFRRFLLRGLEKVGAEWELICLTHNLLKLHRSGWVPERA
jgi:transposase